MRDSVPHLFLVSLCEVVLTPAVKWADAEAKSSRFTHYIAPSSSSPARTNQAALAIRAYAPLFAPSSTPHRLAKTRWLS